MGERIYTGAEALALLEGHDDPWHAEPGEDGRWLVVADSDGDRYELADFDWEETARLAAAAPDLAASVAHHAERADKAEAKRDALRSAAASVLGAWKVTKAQCDEGWRWCRECRELLDEPHDDLCDLRDIAEREALAQLKAAMVPHG
jgi:hypothetical protein